MKLSWRFGVVAGLFLAVFSLYPQLKMHYNREGAWNGHYAYNDIDEVGYASYLKALIDGRPRKNDPYTGRDHTAETPQPESLFSIQFAGAYAAALPARALGISAPWAMTIVGAITAFLTAFIIFWLIGRITGDSLFAMAASLAVLAGGALFGGEGAIGEILGHSYSYPYFPGFRRYVPAMAFPPFFLMIAFVYKLIVEERTDNAPSISSGPIMLAAVLAFAFQVFTYFFVWTTAAAWLACVALCWLIFRPDGVWRDVRKLSGVAAGAIPFLILYAYLLSQRGSTMDNIQLLVETRAPDLLRTPELISYFVLAVIAIAVMLKVIGLRDRATLFAISLALTPIAVFNQQVITGKALQPIHYQVFIGNYVAGLALLVTFGLIWRRAAERNALPMRFLAAGLAIIAIAWGFIECHYTVRILDEVNIARDEAYPVGMRLAELDKNDPDRFKKNVLHLGISEADDLPTIAPQAVLWARHAHIFVGLSWQEHKERYYQLLYYHGVSERELAERMKTGDFVSVIALFGWGRHTDRLTSAGTPLLYREIDAEAAVYAAYCRNFDAARPDVPKLDYVVIPEYVSEDSLENLDRWYERYDTETFGKYTLSKLRLR